MDSTDNKSDIKSRPGIKIKWVNTVLMVLTGFLCFFVFLSSIVTKNKYDDLISSVIDYSESSKAINEFRNATDFLTNQVRLFSVNYDLNFMNNYFEEVNNLQQREKSLMILEMTHLGDAPDVNLNMALRESNYLKEIDCYSMKLICEALQLPKDSIPADLQTIELNPEDIPLSQQEKLRKAQSILFDSTYLASKSRINTYTSTSLSILVSDYLKYQNNHDADVNRLFTYERIELLSLLFLSIFLFLFITFMVLRPLHNQVKNIEKGTRINVEGAYETRYIARTYNSLLEKNEIKASMLKHKAEHDPLTDLINREGFNQIKKILSESLERLAYLLIDVDSFKNINDTYGHGTGDAVLKKIANLLKEKFRNTDYVARIGGDEFSVIMTKFGPSPEDIIQSKISSLNKVLQNVSDGLPSISLSVGVAFSYKGFESVLEEQADKALYRVKNGGKCNCSFYEVALDKNI